MIENIKSLTTDFIQNEKSILARQINPETNASSKDQSQEELSQIVETVNTELLNQRALSGLPVISEISIITTDKTDFSGSSPKRYTTTCYLQPKTIPYWYTESVLLFVNSTKKIYEDKVFFKNKILPVKWSENMSTEVISDCSRFYSSVKIPVTETYISLQQIVV